MLTTNNPDMLSIRELFEAADRYIIPIYQRNYAWEQTHLQQLIQDVWDSCANANGRNYYIGTLVVHRDKNGLYETIDGQQRLTTLNIMLCAMKNEIEKEDTPYPWFKEENLSFQYREKSSSSLRKLYKHLDPSDIDDANILQMYENVKPTMESVFGHKISEQQDDDFERFKEFFFNNVIITRVSLPDDTDLNHYFEIMNTRGEQLEKHEILKAHILNTLKDDPQSSWLASRIWEACSDMDHYVQMNFTDTELRKKLFSDALNRIAGSRFEDLVAISGQSDSKEKPLSIKELCENDSSRVGKAEAGDNSYIDDEARYSSIINFPNFLLHVLRVMLKEDIPLDDKRLLETFQDKEKDKDFAKRFLYQLLRLRFLFDKYIIKRDYIDDRDNGKWGIMKLAVQKNGHTYYKNTFDDKNDERNVMIQSMFHVSLPSQNYKHWLCAALLYLSDHESGDGLYDYLNQLSHAYMLDRFTLTSGQLDYFEIIFTNGGKPHNKCPKDLNLPRFDTNIDRFYFNYLDMQLWLRGDCPDFSFSARSSVEHFYPQHPMENFKELDKEHLHDFGNLCLISRSKNSKLSNFPPMQKTDFYKKTTIDSIKQKIMMDICEMEGTWKQEQIEEHSKEMKKVLLGSFKGIG